MVENVDAHIIRMTKETHLRPCCCQQRMVYDYDDDGMTVMTTTTMTMMMMTHDDDNIFQKPVINYKWCAYPV